MSKNVIIRFEKPNSFKKWSDLSTATHIFFSNGEKFLTGVLSYAYTVKSEDGKNKGTFGPYYDYGVMTNDGRSTICLTHFDNTKQTTSDGKIITYSYSIKLQNINTNNNLYVIATEPEKSKVEKDNFGLYADYRMIIGTYTLLRPLSLRQSTIPDSWDSAYLRGTCRIQEYPNDTLKPFEKFVNKYYDYVKNAPSKDSQDNTLNGYVLSDASKIAQRSRIYQIPTNELSGLESKDADIKLFYTSSYLCEVNPDIKIPDNDSSEQGVNIVTYSYLVNKRTGNVTLDAFPTHSYIYSYMYVPTLEKVKDKNGSYYTGEMMTVGKLFDNIGQYNTFVKNNSFHKKFVYNRTTYSLSYEIGSYISDIKNELDSYVYTSYTFSYDIHGIEHTSFASPFEYLLDNKDKDITNRPVLVPSTISKNILNIEWRPSDPEDKDKYYTFIDNPDKPGEYVKLQFSDNEMRTTKDIKSVGENNKISVTSHSNVFYLNIVQASASFSSFVPKIITTNDLCFYQTVINGVDFGWRIAFVHNTDSQTTSSEIYIGVPKFSSEEEISDTQGSFDGETTSMYDVCIKVDYDLSSESQSAEKDIKTVSEIKQANNVLYASSVDVPIVSVGTKYFWTDDMFNRSGHEYKNVVGIQTSSGIEYFGIRSKKHGQHERNNFRFDSFNPVLTDTGNGTYYLGYDLCGKVVPLSSGKNNDYIYSFKNGVQYLKVSDAWKRKELFPSKISTYEFAVNKEDIVPEYHISYTTNQDERSNINCSVRDLYDDAGNLRQKYSTYSISIPFTKETSVSDNLVIKNSSYYEKTTDTTYEGKYKVVTDNKDVILNNNYVNVFREEISYVKLNTNSINKIKSIDNTDCLYKYNSYLGTYLKYSESELKNLSYLKDVYEKYTLYKEITNSTYNGEDTPVYVQDYKYVTIDKNERPSGTLYYASKNSSDFDYTYIPQGVGIVTDDSIQYYAYTYALIAEDELSKYKKTSGSVFIKENYKRVKDTNEFDTLIAKHVKFYTCSDENGFKKYPISSSQLIDDIDLNGNIIYTKLYSNGETPIEKAVDVSDLKELVSHQNKIASTGILSSKEIETRKNLTRRSAIRGKTTFAAENVVDYICLFDYDDKYTEYTDIYEDLSEAAINDIKEKVENGTLKLYINEVGYREISSKLISVGSKQKYYAWRIDKISPTSVRTLDVSNYVDYIYVDASKFNISHEFGADNMFSGILTNPVTGKKITIAKVNSYGFIQYDEINYYSRTLQTEHTVDLFMHPNKVYYRNNTDNTIKLSGTTPIVNLTYTTYSLVTNTVKFKDDSPYNIYNNSDYRLQIDDAKYYNNTKVVSYLSDKHYSYAYELPYNMTNEFIKTEFLYQTYTVNDNIQKSKGGAYYTNIYVFDKNNGAINKTLYLNQHVVDINTYVYKVVEKTFQKVESDVILGNMSPLNYKDYYVSFNGGEITRLDETSESPSYFFNTQGYTLYTYVKTENDCDYSCQSIVGSYQYYDSSSNIPIVLNVDDNMFGIVANNFDISRTYTSSNGTSYNMFDLEIVKLYRMSKDNVGDVVQEHAVKENVIDKTFPFSLVNDVEYTPTGTYTWHNPEFAYHTYSTTGLSYGWKFVEETAGYWTRDYRKNVIPLQIASYTFYPDTNNISNTSSTYSFVPNSYVLSSVVEYPKISYDTIDTVTEEQIYYSYVLGGVEQHYRSSDKVQVNPDGTYTGLLKQYIFSKDSGKFIYVNKPIELSQHKIVTKNTKITNIVNQDYKLDKSFFAYKTSLALTNEITPVLYNTELMPATTKEIQYWDSETQSYQLKTVIASYAYYAYQYMFDTIPLKVSSYMFKASYLTIDNIADFGAYIAYASYSLTERVQLLNSDLNTWSSYHKAAENDKLLSINKSYELISSYIEHGFTELGNDVVTLSNKITDSISYTLGNLSYKTGENTSNVTNTMSAYGYVFSQSINSLNTNVVRGIEEHKEKVAESLDTLTSYVKNIVLGDSIEIPNMVDIVTRDGIVVSYSSSLDGNLNSLGELLLRSLISVSAENYTYVDDSGLTHNIVKYSYTGIGDSLKRLQIVPGVPSKQEFVMDLVPKMFANIDFDNEIVDEVKYDSNGNITEKKTHKNNPTEMAKKTIYRAGILWEELAKAGYCKDDSVTQKRNLLNNIKKSSLTSNESIRKS